jgi:hypothetical protein
MYFLIHGLSSLVRIIITFILIILYFSACSISLLLVAPPTELCAECWTLIAGRRKYIMYLLQNGFVYTRSPWGR